MKSLPRIGLQLANLGQAGKPNSNRLRNIGYVSILLTILSLFFYSQSFEEEEVHLKPASQSLHSGHGVLDVTDGHDRPLIVYAYSETDDSKENFKFFLKRGLHAAADFIFVFNGPTTVADLVPTHLENVRVVERDNTCYDIGAVGEVLAKDDLWKKYKRFITMNASVRGPFMPVWSKECWTDTLLRKITDKVKVRLFFFLSFVKFELIRRSYMSHTDHHVIVCSLLASHITVGLYLMCSRWSSLQTISEWVYYSTLN